MKLGSRERERRDSISENSDERKSERERLYSSSVELELLSTRGRVTDREKAMK